MNSFSSTLRASLREVYDLDIADPDLGIISVTGLKCAGVTIGTPDFVDAFVRSKADDIQQDVQKLRIMKDPKIQYDLLRFCRHTRESHSSPAMCLLT